MSHGARGTGYDANWITLALISARLDAKMKLQLKDSESKEDMKLTKKLRNLCIEEKKMLEKIDQHSKFLKKEILRIQRRTPSVPHVKPVRIFHQGEHGKQTLSDIRASALSQMSSTGVGLRGQTHKTPDRKTDVSLPLLKLLVNDKELHPTDASWSSITPCSSVSHFSAADGYSADVDTSFSSAPVSISISIPEEDKIATEEFEEIKPNENEKDEDPDIAQNADDEPTKLDDDDEATKFDDEEEDIDLLEESTSSLPSVPEFVEFNRDFVLRVDNRLTRHTHMHLFKFKDDEMLKQRTSINQRSTPADVRQRKAENHCKCIEQIQLRREYLKAAKMPRSRGIETLTEPKKELKLDMKLKVPRYMMKNLSKTEVGGNKRESSIRKNSIVSAATGRR